MSIKLKALYAYIVLIDSIYWGRAAPPGLENNPRALSHYFSCIYGYSICLYAFVLRLYGFVPYMAFTTFASTITLYSKTNDGKPLSNITLGIGFLAFWVPVTNVI